MARPGRAIRRLVQWLLVLTVCLFVLTLAATSILGRVLAGDLDRAKLVKMPLVRADLAIPNPPPDQNSAPLYLAFVRQSQRLVDAAKLPKLSKILPYDQYLKRRIEIMSIIEPAFAQLEQLRFKTGCRFQKDWPEAEGRTEEIQDVRETATQLCQRAVRQDRAGKTESAFKTLELAKHATQDLGSNPMPPARRQTLLCLQSLESACIELAFRHAGDAKSLDRVEKFLHAEPPLPDLSATLGAEIVNGREKIQKRRWFDLSMSIWFEDPPMSFLNPPVPNSPLVSDFMDVGLVSGWQANWQALCEAQADPAKFRQLLPPIYERSSNAMRSTNEWLLSRLWDGACDIDTLRANHRLIEICIGLFRYKQAHGQFPTTLPKELQTGDPSDGKPLDYHRTALGFDLTNPDARTAQQWERYESVSFRGEFEDTAGLFETQPPSSVSNIYGFRDASPEPPWPHFAFHFINTTPVPSKPGSKPKLSIGR